MTVTPLDFAAITNLRVGSDPIPFDTVLADDDVVLQWFLGFMPKVENGSIIYTSCRWRWNPDPTSDLEAKQMARVYLLYLFGVSLFPNRRNQVHWDLWDGLDEPYLARSRESLRLPAFRVPAAPPAYFPWPWGYTVAELERFTVLETDLSPYLCPTEDYAAWRERNLVGPLRLAEFQQVKFSATTVKRMEKGQGGATKRVRGGRSNTKVVGGLLELSWEIEVIDLPQPEEPFEPITCQGPPFKTSRLAGRERRSKRAEDTPAASSRSSQRAVTSLRGQRAAGPPVEETGERGG
ncbi:hypothetical protein RHMOL_Rhmol02G0174100 [Rhododendron molle]|uniref:Uncharacterized protein n=1 Tax=Rhododendron molle TaxID=49168 RepID=A0ACC0PTZ9_RHOML|nr:hypothetical protein RHMOL_Rhmol02G0174100 [Rhododendron molle]